MCDLSNPNNTDSGLLKAAESYTIDIEKDRFNKDNNDDDEYFEPPKSSLLSAFLAASGLNLKKCIKVLFALAYAAFFIAALVLSGLHKCDHEHDIVPLIVLTVLVLVTLVVSYTKDKFSSAFEGINTAISGAVKAHWHVLRWIIFLVPLLGLVAIVIIAAVQRPSNLMSLVGWALLVLILVACSKAPKKVKWRPVLGGFAFQFFFGTLILKWDKGYELFSFIGDVFGTFLEFSDIGASFVFGKLDDHMFAFKVLPIIIFFSCVISMLYHLGVMQAIIRQIAYVMDVTLGTTPAESLCAAGNIFVGHTVAPIMIRPFLAVMTNSELHAVMVGGYATIAGNVLAAFIMKGVSAIHLITASFMNAPAALAVSKLLYPELGKSRIAKMNKLIEEKGTYNNIIDAAAFGAASGISLVANIGANLIAFVALLYFTDSALSWFGSFICFPQLSFQLLCHYALMPLTFIMGVDWSDAGRVAELIGIKTFLNEFVAYDKMSGMVKNRVDCLDGPTISMRSEIIATYALCGFANLTSVGITLGALGPMAPKRHGDLSRLAVSALFGGIVANLMSACVAGLLVVEDPLALENCLNGTVLINTVVNSSAL